MQHWVRSADWCNTWGTAGIGGLEAELPIPGSVLLMLPSSQSHLPSQDKPLKVRRWTSLLSREWAQGRKPRQGTGVQLSLANS